MNIINWIANHWVEISAAVSGIVVAARIVVKLTPTPTDDTILDKLVTILSHIGLTSDTIDPRPLP